MLSLYPITIEFPLTPLRNIEVSSLICVRKHRRMDSCRIVLNIDPDQINPYVTSGSPFRAVWYAEGSQDEFVGYVHSFRPEVDGYRRNMVIVGVGSSYPLFNQSARTFRNITIDQIAKSICDEHRFQLDSDPHTVVLEQILQKEDSDWSMLQRLAEQWGYVLMFHGVTMVYRPLQVVLEDKYLVAERMSTTSMASQSGSKLLSFRPSFSAAGRTGYVRAVGAGSNPLSAETIPWKAAGPDGAFQQVSTGYPVSSELESTMIAVAQDAESRFPFTAEAEVRAPIGAAPFDALHIDHQGSKMTWVVESVKHVITPNSYVGELLLGSDGKDYVKTNAQPRLNVESIVSRGKDVRPAKPVILNTRPYLVGSGTSVVVSDHRWRASVIDVGGI